MKKWLNYLFVRLLLFWIVYKLITKMRFENGTDMPLDSTEYSAPVKQYPYPWLTNPVIFGFIIISIIGNVAIFALVCLSKTFRR